MFSYMLNVLCWERETKKIIKKYQSRANTREREKRNKNHTIMHFGENSILELCLISERQLFILHFEFYYFSLCLLELCGDGVCFRFYALFLSIYLFGLIYSTELLHLEFHDYLLISQICLSNSGPIGSKNRHTHTDIINGKHQPKMTFKSNMHKSRTKQKCVA